MKLLIIGLLLLLPVVAWGGDQNDDLAKYFPMEKDSVWIYGTSKKTPKETITIKDYISAGWKHEHILSNGTKYNDTYRLLTTEHQIIKTTSTNLETGETVELIPEETILVWPIEIGTKWKSNNGLEQNEIINKLPIMKVIAGNYNDVIVVESRYFETNGTETKRNYLYYAPYVGIIKIETMDVTSGETGKKSTIKELIKYTRKYISKSVGTDDNLKWYQYERVWVWRSDFQAWDKWPIQQSSCTPDNSLASYTKRRDCQFDEQQVIKGKPIIVDVRCEMDGVIRRLRFIKGSDYCEKIRELDASGQLEKLNMKLKEDRYR